MEFQFEIGDQVSVATYAPGRTLIGVVNGIYIDDQGVSYNVQTFDDHGVVHRDYFTASKLTKV